MMQQKVTVGSVVGAIVGLVLFKLLSMAMVKHGYVPGKIFIPVFIGGGLLLGHVL